MQPHTARERPLGRRIFGRDAGAYDRFRLGYPPKVFEILRRRCGLGPGSIVLEIGPGTGKATRPILAERPERLVALEPNARLARYLREHAGPGRRRLDVRVLGFEEADLPAGGFDLIVAATSFHWLDERRALRRVARLLRPGGWWAAWWNHAGGSLGSVGLLPDLPGSDRPTPADRRAAPRRRRDDALGERSRRLARLRADGRFDRVRFEEIRWSADRTADQVRGLWGTFAEVASLPASRRRSYLEALERSVDGSPGGRIRVPFVTPVYTTHRIGCSPRPPPHPR